LYHWKLLSETDNLKKNNVCNTYRTTENSETKGTLEGGSWKRCENVTNKELAVYSYEQRRMEATLRETRTL
jgi:hypothetical protein